MLPNVFIGPMSKNIVDAVIEFCEEHQCVIGLIPSRRQIEFDGGYVNNWSTADFVDYVYKKSLNVILQRDHGGPMQGANDDDGLISFSNDAHNGFDFIHIDPWKAFPDINDALEATIVGIKHCNNINPDCFYEVGTEEAIRPYESRKLDEFLLGLRFGLGGGLFKKIKYAVIQSGTSIEGTKNTGKFSRIRCMQMVGVCESHGLLSKEHNGDYLSIDSIKERFKLGLHAINIAPEFGVLETDCILKEVGCGTLFEKFYDLCYRSDKWRKWVSPKFKPDLNKREIIRISGHYVFSNPEFSDIKQQLAQDIDIIIKKTIKTRLEELWKATRK